MTISQILYQPVVLTTFLTSFGSLTSIFFYCTRRGLVQNDKQTSSILTLVSSSFCTVASVPFFVRFWRSGWDIAQLNSDANVHTAMACFFVSYLILDLILGFVYYRSHMALFTGWIHHLLCIGILFWLLQCHSVSLFTAIAFMELPTLLDALGSMKECWRSDILFALSFFLSRLVLHSYVTIALKRSQRLHTLWLFAAAILPLNLYRFHGIIAQQIKQCPGIRPSLFLNTPCTPEKCNTTKRRAKQAFLDRIYTI